MTPELLNALRVIASQEPTKLTSLAQLKSKSWAEIDAVNQCIAHARFYFKAVEDTDNAS